MMRTALVALLLCSSAFAHDGIHDDWFKSLQNRQGISCCDGADALRIEDPDWDIAGQNYRVRLGGVWQAVPPERVVSRKNIVGFAIVWPYVEDGVQKVRCFLPGPVV